MKSVILDEAHISEKEQLSEAAFRIRLQGDSIQKMNFVPGAFLRLGIGIGKEDLAMKDKIRSYSIWNINQAAGYMVLAIATHGSGVGSQWIKDCKVGEKVHYKLKKGNFIADENADSYLMIGDLSALSHLYMIHRHIGEAKQVNSMVYSPKTEELFADIDGSTPFNFFEWPQNPLNQVLEKLEEITPNMSGQKMVYIAGDSRLCVALNHYFRKDLGWNSKQIKTKPFWNPEKIGLE